MIRSFLHPSLTGYSDPIQPESGNDRNMFGALCVLGPTRTERRVV